MIKRLIRLSAVAGLAMGLTGCFQPLYAPNLGASSPVLGNVQVDPMPGHIGHHLKSELDFLLNNGTPPEKPLYRLVAAPRGGQSAVVVDYQQSRPQVMAYVLASNYTLTSIKDGKVIANGSAHVQASFDRNVQRFATVRAIRDVEIRAATQLAEQIRNRIMPAIAGLKD